MAAAMALRMAIVATVLLCLTGSATAAAWNETRWNATSWNATLSNSTANCTDEIVGYSPWFGVQGESKPMRVQNHTIAWRLNGPLTKINLYYSWNYKCLQGIKATYGNLAGNARMIGHEKKLYSQHLALAPYEDVVRVDVKQEPDKCVNWIKFTTNKGRSLGFGNSASTSPVATARPPFKGGYLAFFKGWEDLVAARNASNADVQASGGLQSLQFVWAAEYCPNSTHPAPYQQPLLTGAPPPAKPPAQPAQLLTPTAGPAEAPMTKAPRAAPRAPAPSSGQQMAPMQPEYEQPASDDDEAEAPTVTIIRIPGQQRPQQQLVVPVQIVTPQPLPVVPAQQPLVQVHPLRQPVCPPITSQCDTAAQQGEAGFCPARLPFAGPACEGGCCVSSGRCRKPLCRANGLGADVVALDFICFGLNNGPFGGLNKCRGLRCKLAVPGCRSGPFGGHCVGYVVADSGTAGINELARQYVGRPCIEVAAPPHGPKLPSLTVNINHRRDPSASLEPLDAAPAAAAPGHAQQQQVDQASDYASGLWTVCDCTAQHQHPVIPAIPLFGLKKALLGATHPLFAGLAQSGASLLAHATGGSSQGVATAPACKGPLCALLPMLPSLNVTLDQVQVPMTMLANLTSLLRPHPLSLPPIEAIIPQIQLPEVNVTVDSPITRPELPTFADCAKYLIDSAKALRPVVGDLMPHFHNQTSTQQLGELAKVASMVLSQLRAEGLERAGGVMGALPKFNVKDLIHVVRQVAPLVAPHTERGPTYNVKLLDIHKTAAPPAPAAPTPEPLQLSLGVPGANALWGAKKGGGAGMLSPHASPHRGVTPPLGGFLISQPPQQPPLAQQPATTVTVVEQPQQMLQQQQQMPAAGPPYETITTTTTTTTMAPSGDMSGMQWAGAEQQQFAAGGGLLQQQQQQPFLGAASDDGSTVLPDDYDVVDPMSSSSGQAGSTAGGLLTGGWQQQQQQQAPLPQQQQQQQAMAVADPVAEWADRSLWY